MLKLLNWAGNKVEFINEVNQIVKGKSYNRIIDGFLGSGNLLLNICCGGNHKIGYDVIKLVPNMFLELIKNNQFKATEIKNTCLKWNLFKFKKDYYDFRNYWNKKYIENIFNKEFIIETVLLLKMCSNSMIRFNQNGEFNQGFRGEKENGFFSEKNIKDFQKQLELLGNEFSRIKYDFYNKNFLEDLHLYGKNDLLLLDPPYILAKGMYSQGKLGYNEENENKLLKYLCDFKGKYIYFNYLSKIDSDGNKFEYKKLKDFLMKQEGKVKIINLRKSATTGQKRNGKTEVEEIIVTNEI